MYFDDPDKLQSITDTKAGGEPATFAERTAAAFSKTRVDSNGMREWVALANAYDERIKEIKDAGLGDLSNIHPMRKQWTLNPVSDGVVLADGSVPEPPETVFQKKLEELAQKNPDKAWAIKADRPVDARDEYWRRANRAEQAERNYGGPPLTGPIADFIGGMGAQAVDPLSAPTIFMGPTSRVGQGARSILAMGAKQAAANMMVEAGFQPFIQQWRKEMGDTYGWLESAKEIGMAGAFGFIADAGVRSAYRGGQILAGRKPILDEQGRVTGYESGAKAADRAEGVAAQDRTNQIVAAYEARNLEIQKNLEALPKDTFDRIAQGDDEATIAFLKAVKADEDPSVGGAINALRNTDRVTLDGIDDGWRERSLIQQLRALEDPSEPAPAHFDAAAKAERPRLADDAELPKGTEGNQHYRMLDLDGKPVRFEAVDANRITTDPATFQFKGGRDSAGASNALRAVDFDGRYKGKVIVYEREDGSLVVADGHDRVSLANRAPEPQKLNALVFREKDGWTAEQVRAEAARKNIQEGTGSLMDVAGAIRRHPEIVDDSMAVGTDFMADARSIARLSDEAFDAVAGGQFNPKHGVLVSDHVPDQSRHMEVLRELDRRNPPTEAAARREIGNMLREPANMETLTRVMDIPLAEPHVIEARNDVLAGVMTTLRQEPGYIGEIETQAIAAVIRRLAEKPGLVSDTLAQAGRAVAEGQPLERAIDATLRRFEDVIGKAGVKGLADQPVRLSPTDERPRFLAALAGSDAAVGRSMRAKFAENLRQALDEATTPPPGRLDDPIKDAPKQVERLREDLAEDIAVAMGQPSPAQLAALQAYRAGRSVMEPSNLWFWQKPEPSGTALMFHATNRGFDKFDLGQSADFGIHFGTAKQAATRLSDTNRLEGGRTIPAEVTVRNAIAMDDQGFWGPVGMATELQKQGYKVTAEEWKRFTELGDAIDQADADVQRIGNSVKPRLKKAVNEANDAIKAKLNELGIDGIWYKNTAEGRGWSLIVWNEGQVKSATTGEQLFSRPQTSANPDILAMYERYVTQEREALDAVMPGTGRMIDEFVQANPEVVERIAEALGAPTGRPQAAQMLEQAMPQFTNPRIIDMSKPVLLTPEANARMPDIRRELDRTVQMLPPEYRIRVEDSLVFNFGDGDKRLDGLHDGYEKLIYVSMAAGDPVRTSRHEVIHALRQSGLMKDEEFAALYKFADRLGLRKAYEIDTQYKAPYTEAYGNRGADFVEQLLREETVANMFSDYSLNGRRFGDVAGGGMVDRLIDMIVTFMKQVRDIMGGYGFRNVYDVFESIESGAMARRGMGQMDGADLASVRQPLDMSPEARKARAEQMGFDTGKVFYHGTRSVFQEFKLKDGSIERGFFFSDDPNYVSKSYAQTQSAKPPRDPVEIRSDIDAAKKSVQLAYDNAVSTGDWTAWKSAQENERKLLNEAATAQEQSSASSPSIVPVYLRKGNEKIVNTDGHKWRQQNARMIEEARSEGYDSLTLRHPDGVSETIVFDPTNIRSVNATFDPAEAGSARLLADMAQDEPSPLARDLADVQRDRDAADLVGACRA